MKPFLQQLLPESLSEIHKYSWPVADNLLDIASLKLALALYGDFPSLV